MNLTHKIADLYREFGLFSSSAFNVEKDKNILNTLHLFPEFEYLSNFYEEYECYFNDISDSPIVTREARNRDLPFIGKVALEAGRPRYFFVFEGSLSQPDVLSITVLSHLWLTDNPNTIKEFCGKGKWWTQSNYINIKKQITLIQRNCG